MKPFYSFVVLPVAAVTLTSCGDQEKEAASQDMLAGGKILQRSISDEMLPYDTVRSQPPLAEPENKGDDSASSDGTDEAAGDDANATESGGAPQTQSEANAGSTTPAAD